MSFWALVIGGLLGAGAAWLLVRRRRAPGVAPGVSPHLLPDPALAWLRRAHGASGVWVAEMDSREGEPRAERVVDADRLSVTQIVAVDRRLERARDQEQSGAERMEGGTLVFHGAAGIAVGLLLPGGSDAVRLEAVESDLRRLADGVRRRPQLVQLAHGGQAIALCHFLLRRMVEDDRLHRQLLLLWEHRLRGSGRNGGDLKCAASSRRLHYSSSSWPSARAES